MSNKEIRRVRTYNNLLSKIARILAEARTKLVRGINRTQVLAYREIGKEIIEFEQKGKARAKYGEELIKKLSKDMTEKFGMGFSEINLRNMRRFYLEFPAQIQQTLSVKSQKQQTLPAVSKAQGGQFEPMLSWSHYCELLKIEEPLARSFYEQEAIENNWSVRELKRQINSMLFERLTLSRDTKGVMKMAKKGQVIEKPEDAIKDPYILEFLNLKEETSYTESQLEQAIIELISTFSPSLGIMHR
jgi:predicted nuclease of restriction endonuclease-like (RecB) superfamily